MSDELFVKIPAGAWVGEIARRERAAFLAGISAGPEAATCNATDEYTGGGDASSILARLRRLDAEQIAKEAEK